MTDDIRERVIRELQWLHYDVSAVTGETRLGPDGLGLESMAVAELAVLMEEAFHVTLEEIELDRLAEMTFSEFVAEVDRRRAAP